MTLINDISFWGYKIKKDVGTPDLLIEWHVCQSCQYICPTVQGLNWHLFKVHGVRNLDRALIEGTVCCACLSEFWSRERLVIHITSSSPKCRSLYRSVMCRMSPEALERVEAKALVDTKALAASGRRRTHAAMPVFRVRGPLLAVAADFGISFYTGLKKVRRGVAVTPDDEAGQSDVDIGVVADPSVPAVPSQNIAPDVKNDVMGAGSCPGWAITRVSSLISPLSCCWRCS